MATAIERKAMTEKDTAAYMCVSEKTLQKWRWQGCGPAFLKVGRLIRYRLEDVDAYLDSCKRTMAGSV